MMHNRSGNAVSSRILYVEEWSETTGYFIQDLHAGTGCNIEHAGTLEEALRKIEQAHGDIGIVLYTVTPTSNNALVFPERVRAVAEETLLRCPYFVLLASAPLNLPCAVKCMDRQVVYLLRDCTKQVVETVRVLLWKIRTSKPGPTIRVVFRGGHYRFFICGMTTSEEIVISRQIGRLLLLLLRRTYTVDMLADELGISRQSVKKYIRELRGLIASALKRMHIAEPVQDLVWMERSPGGTICGLKANPVWL